MLRKYHWSDLFILVFWVGMLSFFFAQVEIQIEGGAGWGRGLPTWRVEQHWLLDLFWGGRAMTGYHAWIFPFISMIFHFPCFMLRHWSLRWEIRIISSIILFWILEDFFWFVFNPAFGLQKFTPEFANWHKHWVLGVPVEYIWGSILSLVLIHFSFTKAFQKQFVIRA